MLHALGEIFGFIGGAIGIATALPQVFRIRKLGHTEGLAVSPWILMYLQFVAWTAFGFKVASPSVFISNFLTVGTTLLVVIAILGNSFKNWLVLAAGALATCAFVFYAPELLVNGVLVVLTASRLPQLIKTWINRRTAIATAVSVQSLLVALVSMSFWMGFAILTENKLIVLTTIVAMSITLATAVIESRIAKRATV